MYRTCICVCGGTNGVAREIQWYNSYPGKWHMSYLTSSKYRSSKTCSANTDTNTDGADTDTNREKAYFFNGDGVNSFS
jgi:hypothetical protein